jgi:hypothetical protein
MVAEGLFKGKQREGARGYFYTKLHNPDEFLGWKDDRLKLPGMLEAWSLNMRLAIYVPVFADLPDAVKDAVDPHMLKEWAFHFPEIGSYVEEGGLPWYRHPVLITIPRRISNYSMSTNNHYDAIMTQLRYHQSVLLIQRDDVCGNHHRNCMLRRGSIYARPPASHPKRRPTFLYTDYQVRCWTTHLHEWAV